MKTSSRVRSASSLRRNGWQRALVSVVAALVLVAAPFAARDAAAQRPGGIGAVAMVAAPYLAIALHSDLRTAAVPPDVQQVRVSGFDILDVQSATCAAIRVARREAVRPTQDPAGRPDGATVRVTIDYIGS